MVIKILCTINLLHSLYFSQYRTETESTVGTR